MAVLVLCAKFVLDIIYTFTNKFESFRRFAREQIALFAFGIAEPYLRRVPVAQLILLFPWPRKISTRRPALLGIQLKLVTNSLFTLDFG